MDPRSRQNDKHSSLPGRKVMGHSPAHTEGEGKKLANVLLPNKWVEPSVSFPHHRRGCEFSVCAVHFREYVSLKFLNITQLRSSTENGEEVQELERGRKNTCQFVTLSPYYYYFT